MQMFELPFIACYQTKLFPLFFSLLQIWYQAKLLYATNAPLGLEVCVWRLKKHVQAVNSATVELGKQVSTPVATNVNTLHSCKACRQLSGETPAFLKCKHKGSVLDTPLHVNWWFF